MNAADSHPYFVIPLSIQKDDDCYLIGNVDLGDFYQFPELGFRILDMLKSGNTIAAIKAHLAADALEQFDVDEFVDQLKSIGFVYAQEERAQFTEVLAAASNDNRRVFNIDRRIARAIFSIPVLIFYLATIGYAATSAIMHPELRINWSAFYTETNRTLLLLCIFTLSLISVVLHEIGHMLAIARYGMKSRYDISNRLWYIVAETDLTGTMALPKSRRYLPLCAGMLVDILNISIVTIALRLMLDHGVTGFAIQVAQALVLEIVISIAWQFNIFVKTDIYYVLSNYFSYPDLDRDARIYLKDLLYRRSFGRLGSASTEVAYKNKPVLRAFSVVWLFGRLWSLLLLFGVFLPTIWKYIVSAVAALNGPPASMGVAYDTLMFALITLTMSGVGFYMWLKNR